MEKTPELNLPWVEKYRPSALEVNQYDKFFKKWFEILLIYVFRFIYYTLGVDFARGHHKYNQEVYSSRKTSSSCK